MIDENTVRIAEDKAGFFSRYSYYWITPLLEKGYRQQLKLDDMPDLCQGTFRGHSCTHIHFLPLSKFFPYFE